MTATLTSPTTAGQRIEQARYTIPAGTRGPYLQRIDGRVALVDVPVDHADRVLLVERHVESLGKLHGVVAPYIEHSTRAGLPPSWPAAVRSTKSPESPRDRSARVPRGLRVARPDPTTGGRTRAR